MSQTQEAKSHSVKVSDAGPSRKKLSIEVPAEVVTTKLKDSFDGLASEAELPGFRKGRVPRALVEKRFGAAVRKEAKVQLVSQAFRDAVSDLKLRVVGDPMPDKLEELDLHEGKPFAFDIEVEVMPEFDLPKLEGIEITKPIMEVSDALVEEELKKLTINEGSLEGRESSEPGDYITGHAVMTGPDGKEFYNLKGAVVQSPPLGDDGKQVAKGMILGIMVDDFSKQLGSPKPGDSVTIKATGPANHEVEGLRNAELTIAFKADRVDRIIPAPVDQLVAAYGMESADRLKEFIRTRLKAHVNVQQSTAMRQQLSKHLVDATTMELPERLTASQTTRTLERRRLELMYRGFEPHKIEEHMAELRAASNANAVRDLKLFFILSRAAEDLSVRVDENEINNRITQIAMQRGVRPEQLRQELIRTNQVGGLFQQIRDHKTMDAILSKASVKEMPMDDYNKMVKESEVAKY